MAVPVDVKRANLSDKGIISRLIAHFGSIALMSLDVQSNALCVGVSRAFCIPGWHLDLLRTTCGIRKISEYGSEVESLHIIGKISHSSTPDSATDH